MKNYPTHVFQNNKQWLRDVRKRWARFRKHWNNENHVTSGCVYYPNEVYKWLGKFQEMDKLMKEYYKKA